jgi:uncharacterized membrane protein
MATPIKQVAILEFGWHVNPGIHPDYAWFAVNEATQAAYLVGAYHYAAEHWRPWVGLMSTIYLGAPGWTEQNEEYWWSVTTWTDGVYAVRQAYIDLANMEKVMDDEVIPARDPGDVHHEPLLLAINYFFHLIATIVWIGGLALLVLVVWPAARQSLEGDPAQASLLKAIRQRFTPLANLSLVVLIVTGMFQMSADPNYDGMLVIDNDWSRAILLKHVAILGMVIAGVAVQWGVAPPRNGWPSCARVAEPPRRRKKPAWPGANGR